MALGYSKRLEKSIISQADTIQSVPQAFMIEADSEGAGYLTDTIDRILFTSAEAGLDLERFPSG